jgi:hypothetical protein
MSLNSFTLLDTTTYGEASGNYDGSSQDFYGNAVTAADYYAGYSSIQTITFTVTDFVGNIQLEATLNDQAESAAWFFVDSFGDPVTPTTETHPITVLGNFVYLRVRVLGFDAGTINSITINY